jgi:hypothetical protein
MHTIIIKTFSFRALLRAIFFSNWTLSRNTSWQLQNMKCIYINKVFKESHEFWFNFIISRVVTRDTAIGTSMKDLTEVTQIWKSSNKMSRLKWHDTKDLYCFLTMTLKQINYYLKNKANHSISFLIWSPPFVNSHGCRK